MCHSNTYTFGFRRRLFRTIHPNGRTPEWALEDINYNLRMCYLAVSQAIPLVIDAIFLYILNQWFDPTAPLNIKGRNGEKLLVYAYARFVMATISYLFQRVAHDLHFYLFILFVKSFRQEVLKRFGRRDRG